MYSCIYKKREKNVGKIILIVIKVESQFDIKFVFAFATKIVSYQSIQFADNISKISIKCRMI